MSNQKALSFAATALLSVTLAHAQAITKPTVDFIDRFGVNLANGQVSSALDTVAIGGERGISHSIALYSNHFFPLRNYGYLDKFNGGGRFTQIVSSAGVRNLYRVYDLEGTADFEIEGALTGFDPTLTFVALRDERQRLRVTGSNYEYLEWTKPNGTVSRFLRTANPSATYEARLVQVTYPDGFIVYVDFPNAIHTNTGYSLVYRYEADTRAPISETAPAAAPAYGVANWAARNPKHVVAVNSAVCWSGSSNCMARVWPKGTFTWPAGMPRTMYCGERVFSVDTPIGTTTYRYKPYDLAYNGSTLVQGYTPGQRVSPRLFKVKPSNSTQESIEYTYKNLFQVVNVAVREDVMFTQYQPGTFPTGMGSWEYLIQDAGAVTSARVIDLTGTYELGSMYIGEGSAQNVGSLNGGPWRVIFSVAAAPAYLTQVDTIDRSIFFKPGLQNFPERIEHSSGAIEVYGYTRNNISSVTENAILTKRSVFPPASACDTNPKTCNQPTSTFDANNQETVYEYHESGQLSRISPPLDQNGKRAEVRYDYQAFRARYFDSAGARVEGTPIWLRVAERRCHDSNYTSSAAAATCNNGDEVITRYEYNNNNLLLTSTATTGAGGKTLRRCFQYDIYGNKIGDTEPKGAANCR